jgi:hypothetical protein
MTNDLNKSNNSTEVAFTDDLAAQLEAGIGQSRATTVLAGGSKPFLRMGKDGVWVYGPEPIEVEEGSLWQVNVITAAHGWCCWKDAGDKNTLAGEIMISMAQPKPPRPEPIGDTEYAEQRSFELRCVSGEDEGMEVLYKTSSLGGMKAVDKLLAEIQKAIAASRTRAPGSPAYVFPVLALDQDSYPHPKYGKTYIPILDVVAWADINGNRKPDKPTLAVVPEPKPEPKPAQQPEPEPKSEPKPEPAKPARPRTSRQAPEQPAEPAPPVSTQQAHIGQRRRPVSR